MSAATLLNGNNQSLEHELRAHEPSRLEAGRHSLIVGYLLWLFGLFGAHRFYFGKPVSGTIYFFTLGLLGVGWIIDLFLMPSLNRKAERRYVAGQYDYNVAWILLTFLGWAGVHRLYLGKWISGGFMVIVALSTPVFWPLAAIVALIYLYDYWTLNEQIATANRSI